MSQRAQDPTAPEADPSASSSSSSTKPASGEGAVPDDQSPAEAFRDVGTRLAELSDYLSYYVAARTDAIKASVRNAGLYAALGVIGLFAGGALVVTAVVLLLRGIAGGLAVLFGNRLWLGELVTAILFLALIGGGAWFMLGRLTKASRERTVKKYVSRQQQQRAKFGTDVKERAQSPGK